MAMEQKCQMSLRRDDSVFCWTVVYASLRGNGYAASVFLLTNRVLHRQNAIEKEKCLLEFLLYYKLVLGYPSVWL